MSLASLKLALVGRTIRDVSFGKTTHIDLILELDNGRMLVVNRANGGKEIKFYVTIPKRPPGDPLAAEDAELMDRIQGRLPTH